MNRIDIKQANEADIHTIESILLDTVNWVSDMGQPLWNAEDVIWSKLSKSYKIDDFYIAYSDGVPSGCMALINYDPFFCRMQKGESLFMHKLAVTKIARKTGVADALMDFFKEQGTELGVKMLRLDTDALRPKTRKFYERHGFEFIEEKVMGKFHVAFYIYNTHKKESLQMNDFIKQLSSNSPVPGGGGASALVGGIGVALCSMVANLTSGKKKYVEYQAEIEAVLERTNSSIQHLIALIEKDAEVFEPLSQAYSIPKENPDRIEILETALIKAYSVPLEIMDEIESIVDVLEILVEKGSKLTISDVGIAATVLRSAVEGAALNVYINTKLMKNLLLAKETNKKAEGIITRVVPRCDKIYAQVKEGLVSE